MPRYKDRIGMEVFDIYAADYLVRSVFRDVEAGRPARLVAELGLHCGTCQLVVTHTFGVNP